MKQGSKGLIFSLFFILAVTFGAYYYHEEIYLFIRDYIIKERDGITIQNDSYTKQDAFFYVQTTRDFIAKDQKHLRNIFYTVLNSGNSSFTFYCDDAYTTCLDDVKRFANDQEELSKLNHFVHPYHSFSKVNVEYTSKGKITIRFQKQYSEEEIILLDHKVTEISDELLDVSMNSREKIQQIHDYIINHSKYVTNEDSSEKENTLYHKATGVLLHQAGLCGSYTDAMALFLDYLQIPNYKIASDTHIWNLAYVDQQWLHLDLTWDDPVVSDGKDYLKQDFFLISTTRLHDLDQEFHLFDANTYQEAV